MGQRTSPIIVCPLSRRVLAPFPRPALRPDPLHDPHSTQRPWRKLTTTKISPNRTPANARIVGQFPEATARQHTHNAYVARPPNTSVRISTCQGRCSSPIPPQTGQDPSADSTSGIPSPVVVNGPHNGVKYAKISGCCADDGSRDVEGVPEVFRNTSNRVHLLNSSSNSHRKCTQIAVGGC